MAWAWLGQNPPIKSVNTADFIDRVTLAEGGLKLNTLLDPVTEVLLLTVANSLNF